MQAGQYIDTVTGWCSLVTGAPWSACRFELSSTALELTVAGVGSPSVLALTEIVGLDHLGDDPDGLAILEFALAAGTVAHARVPGEFVDAVVAALQRSRVEPPPPPPPPVAAPGPVDASPVADPAPQPVAEPDPEPVAAPQPEPEPVDAADIDDPPPPPPGRSGTKAALAAEVRALRDYLDGLGFPERRALRADIDSLIAHRTEVLAEVRAATRARREQEVALVRVRKEAVLQDVGVYRPRHPAENSVTLGDRLAEVHARIDELIEAGEGVSATDDWTVNGSRSEGRKVVDDLAHLLLRAYNAEADLLVSTIRPYEVDAAIERLTVTLATIHRLGAAMEIEICDDLHRLRTEELTLAADQLELEDRARRAAAAAGAGAAAGSPGHLYVASNRGAFGEGVVRVGVTGLADPAAVVDEIDRGALPFRSDLHALVPSDDPTALLAIVHDAFDTRRLNLTDPDGPFFAVGPDEIRDALVSSGATVPWFVVDAVAEEWRRSENARHEHDDLDPTAD